MEDKPKFPMIAKTLTGLEKVLARELADLGASNIKPQRRAVSFEGDKKLMYKANLWSRAALSILKPIKEFPFDTQEDYYDRLRALPWDEYFSVTNTFSITAVASQSVFINTHFLAQRTKDAIVDFFREKTNSRPQVDIENPDVKIQIYIYKDICSVLLDSSGIPLFKRSYRRKSTIAPVNEVLAAGLIYLSGWDQNKPFYDPMCGSATFSIEAALMALNIPPQSFRKNFAFQHWPDYEAQIWKDVRDESKENRKEKTPPILASDISNRSMIAARQNLMDAGLLGLVELQKRDFFASKPRHANGYMLINPPYGKRIETRDVSEFFGKMGTTFKHQYQGFKVWVLSPDKQLTNKIGLKPIAKHYVYNGQLDCTFLGYEIYGGSKKRPRLTQN